jgi:DnaA family protein
MRQLLLNIDMPQDKSLGNFVVGRNRELLLVLHKIAARVPGEQLVYLWGEPASGKTHLLTALSQYRPARYISATAAQSAFLFDPETDLYLLDDSDQLSPENQLAVFALFNQIRESGGFLVVAGNAPPARLSVRDDLRSRFAWGLAYAVCTLTDSEKTEALSALVREKGVSVAHDVLPHLIGHYPRDMHSLADLLDALDQYSFQTKRAITLPLLREMMQMRLAHE